MHLPSDAAQLCSCKNEGHVAVPATLRSCLGCLLRRCCTSKTRKRVDERSTRDFALAIAGIGDSCSGYVGFRSWLLYAGLLSVSLSLSLSLSVSYSLSLSFSCSFSPTVHEAWPSRTRRCSARFFPISPVRRGQKSKSRVVRSSTFFLVFPGRGGLAGTAIPDSSNDRAQRGID